MGVGGLACRASVRGWRWGWFPNKRRDLGGILRGMALAGFIIIVRFSR